MSLPLRELAITAVVAAGFTGIGEALLRRTSMSVADTNAAFVTGIAVCASLLFPLSLASPSHALHLAALLVGAGVLWAALARLLGRKRRPAAIRRSPGLDPAAALVLTAAALVGLGFAALNFRYNLLWDGFQIWASKAQLLSAQGALSREGYPGAPTYELRHLAYPNSVPLYEALVGLARGGFDFDGLKPVFLVFYLSMAASTWAAARAQTSARLAAWATLLVCLVPALSTQWAAGAYADMPQAAVVAAVAAAALRRDARALPWVVGALTTVKSEGVVLAALACGGAALYLVAEARRGGAPRGWVRFAVIVAVFLTLRAAYGRWIHAPEPVYAMDLAHLHEAWTRIPRVAGLCLAELFDIRAWGLLWPAFFACSAILARRGDSAEKGIAAAVAAGVPVMAAPFLFTTWPIELHVSQAYFRLLAQLAPAAAVACVLAYARAAAVVRSWGPPLETGQPA